MATRRSKTAWLSKCRRTIFDSGLGATLPLVGVIQRVSQRGSEPGRIAGGNTPAGDPFTNGLPQTAHSRGHDRSAAGQRFENGEAQTLGAARLHADVRGAVVEPELAPGVDGVGGNDALADAGLRRLREELTIAAAAVEQVDVAPFANELSRTLQGA